LLKVQTNKVNKYTINQSLHENQHSAREKSYKINPIHQRPMQGEGNRFQTTPLLRVSNVSPMVGSS